MTNRVAFLTTIFPMNPEYLFVFFTSLQKQTYQQFDVIVVNDGYEGLEVLRKKFSTLNIIELKHSGSPAKNREHGINYVIDHEYSIIVFGDSDDYFDHDRVQVSVEKLNNCDVLVNDLALFNEDGVYQQKYISNRIQDGFQVDIEFIKDKNIFGLSNTALKVALLDSERVYFSQDLVAVDWYFYTKLLLLENTKAIFTNKIQTYYRQYGANTIGMGEASKEVFQKTRLVKRKHYALLAESNRCFKKLYDDEKKVKNHFNLREKQLKTPLWWEC